MGTKPRKPFNDDSSWQGEKIKKHDMDIVGFLWHQNINNFADICLQQVLVADTQSKRSLMLLFQCPQSKLV